MKGFSLNKFQNILNNFFPNINVDSEKSSVHKIACCQCLRNGNQMLITKKLFGALLTDLSKTFGCLSHNLLIAKLNDHGFSMTVLRLIQSYLSNRKQRTKINTDNSSWEENVFGQSSILGPLLFNILLYGLFLIITNIELAGYTDDNTPYAVGSNIEELIVYYKTTQKHCFNGKVITKWN